jgi:16S rRNA (cytosine967-C5)-methyltransferase
VRSPPLPDGRGLQPQGGKKMNLRLIGIEILTEFERGNDLRSIIENRTSKLKAIDRAFLREIVLGTIRYKKFLDFCIKSASGKDPERQLLEVKSALRLSAYQITFMKVPPYAAINETVEAVKRILNKKFAGFVNAVSRKLVNFNCKESIEKIENRIERISTLYSFETWMVKRWETFYNDIENLLSGLNKTAPLYMRINRIKISPEDFTEMLRKEGIDYEKHHFLKDMVRVKGRVDIKSLPGYKDGYFYIQDPASYLSAYLLNPQEGELILDIAAAPGGKTTAIASLSNNRASIVAVDINEDRLRTLEDNIKRLSVKNVKIVKADITKSYGELESYFEKFGKILIDAPCSATGIIRRHPEGKWNKSLSLIKHNQKVQRKLIKSAFKLLKPGGILLYSVCSLEREEGEDNIPIARKAGFEYTQFNNLPGSLKGKVIGNSLRVFPHTDNMDGFFYSIFKRS